MGQKVNPIGLRLGVNRTWDSRWFASRGEYARLLHEDLKMREHILTSRGCADRPQVEAVEGRGLDQGVEDGRAMAAAVRAGEQIIFAFMSTST